MYINILFKPFVGTTLLIEAIAEHNVQSIRIFHKNIEIESFGNLLGFEPYEAKLLAERMISEGRIEGSIDQTNGLITFNRKSYFCYLLVLTIIYISNDSFIHSPKNRPITIST